MENYLVSLTMRLAEGLQTLPADFRARHGRYLAARHNRDGGFSGREGDSDVYYTGFALRGLAILNALTPALSDKTAAFLRESLTSQASVVDFFSLLYSSLLVQLGGGPEVLAGAPPDWPERVAATLETFHAPDHGYAKAPGAASGSTYHTFLVGLCYQILGRRFPRADQVREFVLSRRRDDGGFVEIAPMRRSGTNPTAAAVGTLQLLDGRERTAKDASPAVHFLRRLVSAEGGFRANERVPLADLLSTFTALWTLDQVQALHEIDADRARRYVLSLEARAGGFRGGAWDEHTDVEYTFYGLGALAILAAKDGK